MAGIRVLAKLQPIRDSSQAKVLRADRETREIHVETNDSLHASSKSESFTLDGVFEVGAQEFNEVGNATISKNGQVAQSNQTYKEPRHATSMPIFMFTSHVGMYTISGTCLKGPFCMLLYYGLWAAETK